MDSCQVPGCTHRPVSAKRAYRDILVLAALGILRGRTIQESWLAGALRLGRRQLQRTLAFLIDAGRATVNRRERGLEITEVVLPAELAGAIQEFHATPNIEAHLRLNPATAVHDYATMLGASYCALDEPSVTLSGEGIVYVPKNANPSSSEGIVYVSNPSSNTPVTQPLNALDEPCDRLHTPESQVHDFKPANNTPVTQPLNALDEPCDRLRAEGIVYVPKNAGSSSSAGIVYVSNPAEPALPPSPSLRAGACAKNKNSRVCCTWLRMSSYSYFVLVLRHAQPSAVCAGLQRRSIFLLPAKNPPIEQGNSTVQAGSDSDVPVSRKGREQGEERGAVQAGSDSERSRTGGEQGEDSKAVQAGSDSSRSPGGEDVVEDGSDSTRESPRNLPTEPGHCTEDTPRRNEAVMLPSPDLTQTGQLAKLPAAEAVAAEKTKGLTSSDEAVKLATSPLAKGPAGPEAAPPRARRPNGAPHRGPRRRVSKTAGELPDDLGELPEQVREGVFHVADVYSRLVSERVRQYRRFLTRKAKRPNRHWASFYRVYIVALQDGVAVEELLIAAFNATTDWHGLRYPPPNALTPARLRACYKQARLRDTGAPVGAHPYNDRRWLQAAIANAHKQYLRWTRQGRTLDSLVQGVGPSLCEFWWTQQEFWPQVRDQLLGRIKCSDKLRDFLLAEKQAPYYRDLVLYTCALAAQQEPRGSVVVPLR